MTTGIQNGIHRSQECQQGYRTGYREVQNDNRDTERQQGYTTAKCTSIMGSEHCPNNAICLQAIVLRFISG